MKCQVLCLENCQARDRSQPWQHSLIYHLQWSCGFYRFCLWCKDTSPPEHMWGELGFDCKMCFRLCAALSALDGETRGCVMLPCKNIPFSQCCSSVPCSENQILNVWKSTFPWPAAPCPHWYKTWKLGVLCSCFCTIGWKSMPPLWRFPQSQYQCVSPVLAHRSPAPELPGPLHSSEFNLWSSICQQNTWDALKKLFFYLPILFCSPFPLQCTAAL